jgi:hypothetical protein
MSGEPPVPAPAQKIAFIGAPGTGKSTLAQALVPKLKLLGLDVEFVPEYARSYLRRTGSIESPFENFVIHAGACEREDELDVHDFMVTDSASFLAETYFAYMRHKAGDAGVDPKLDRGQHELARMCLRRLRMFQNIFFVPQGHFNTGKDPTREYLSDQGLIDRMMRAYLDYHLATYHVVRAVGLARRVNEVMRVLVAREIIPAAKARGDGPPPRS